MTTLRFSANTGFLYPDHSFTDRILAAARDGFDALEFHDEAQQQDTIALVDCVLATGLPVLGLNVAMGPTAGCAAIPGETSRARHDIDAAVAVADALDAHAIHVLAGKTKDAKARDIYVANLRHALDATPRTILIEPICSAKMPDYFLNSLEVALNVLAEIDHPRLKILFDCFHIETEHGDTLARARECAAHIGHVQIASVPARAEPGHGPDEALDYAALIPGLIDTGYDGAYGCEYTPSLTGASAFAWRDALRNSLT